MALVVGLISIVAGFNIMSLLITKIQEKKKDLAIFKENFNSLLILEKFVEVIEQL